MSAEQASLCIVCAWRKDCQKKFSRSKDVSFRCAEFTRDMTIGREKADDKKEDRDNGEGRH